MREEIYNEGNLFVYFEDGLFFVEFSDELSTMSIELPKDAIEKLHEKLKELEEAKEKA